MEAHEIAYELIDSHSISGQGQSCLESFMDILMIRNHTMQTIIRLEDILKGKRKLYAGELNAIQDLCRKFDTTPLHILPEPSRREVERNEVLKKSRRAYVVKKRLDRA